MSLTGKVAIVTGAAAGIGLAVASEFASKGATVALVDRSASVEEEAARIAAAHDVATLGLVADVSRRVEVEAASSRLREELGSPWVLVNNAGVSRPGMLWKLTDEEWDTVLGVHLNGTFYWMQAVIPHMREAGGGRIINTVSGAGLNGTIGQANYAAAKAGILGLTRSAARELGGFGILVNAVSPAAATDMTHTIRTDERFREAYMKRRAIERWADPEEIAPAYTFLASEASSYMTGQILAVEGGSTFVR